MTRTRFRLFQSTLLGALLAVSGCMADEAITTSAQLELSVAPLTLPGVGKICYDLRVTDGATKDDPIIWAKGSPGLNGGAGDSGALCSSGFGNGTGGDITFVGACVATPQDAGQDFRTNSVTLWIDGLYDNANAYVSPTGSNGWQNPCANGCTLSAPCRENADSFVEFNLTILREANQGFFDIGVNFDDIFCSAKVDCKNAAGQPLDLLFNLSSGQRDTTIVSGFACTAGPGSTVDTILYRNPLVVTCAGSSPIILDPGAGKGNLWTVDATPADAVFQYAVYAGNESLACGGQPCNKRYWNVAFGFNEATPNCTLTTSMTASSGPLTGFKTPSATTYPYIDVNVPLTTSIFSCSQHPLDGSNGVGTTYTPISSSKSFSRSFNGTTFASASTFTTTGLVLHLDASPASYSGSGTTWSDISGEGNHATSHFSPTWSTTPPFFSLDGALQYFQFAQTDDFKFGTGDFSLEVWIRLKATNTGGGLFDRIFFIGQTLFANSMSWNVEDGTGKVVFRWNDGIAAKSTNALTLNQWKQYVFVRSGNIVYHYVDGAPDGTSSWSLTDVNSAGNYGGFVGRGDHSSSSNSEINADYSKVALYKGHALSSSEVAAHYALLKARYGL